MITRKKLAAYGKIIDDEQMLEILVDVSAMRRADGESGFMWIPDELIVACDRLVAHGLAECDENGFYRPMAQA
jgi:hypothetical protein